MDQIIKNTGFQHITEKFFLDLSYENLLKCQCINKTLKEILNNPLFWLKKWSLRGGLSEKNQTDWMKAIQITKNSILEKKITLFFKRIIQWNRIMDMPCYINHNVVDTNFTLFVGNAGTLSIWDHLNFNIASGNLGIVQVLVIWMEYLITELRITEYIQYSNHVRSPIDVAIENENVEMIKILAPFVDNINARLNLSAFSITPIRLAISKGHIEMIKILASFISNDANTDKNGISDIQDAMFYAAYRGKFDIVKLLRPFLPPKKEEV